MVDGNIYDKAPACHKKVDMHVKIMVMGQSL